jgi:Ca-activated chloride channel family protein
MNAHSFEHQLRQATAPAPDAEAQLRSRNAALAEFQRVHAAANQTISPKDTWLFRLRRLFPGTGRGRSSRNLWLGSLATACVVVVAVSTFFLVPPGQRQVAVRPSIDTATIPEVNNPTPPVIQESEPVAPTPAMPEEKTEAQQPKAVIPPEAVRGRPKALNPHRQRTGKPASSAEAITTPDPSVIAPVSPPEVDEVVVGHDKVYASAMTASTAVAAVQPSPGPGSDVGLGEISVTGTRATKSSWFNRMFSRKEPQSIQQSFRSIDEGRDQFEHFEINPVKQVSTEPVSTFSADVDTASYSFVRRELNQGRLPQVDSVRVEEMINYFDYAWPASESRDQPFEPTVTVSDSPWGEGKKLIHIGIKGYELPVRQQPDINLVLLLDVSGSMDEPDKLPLAQKSMALLLATLKPSDTVAIVVYAGAAGEVLPPTPIKQKETILQALYSLTPGGSTAGAEGIKLAYDLAERSFRKNGVNRILLATDGDFNVGITNRNELKGFVEREREKGVFLSFLGFGEGNYRDDMGQTLAQNGNGVAAYIDTLNEAKKVLVQESTASLFTIAKDVKFQVEFNPATVAEYRLVGYETRALNREDFNNDKVDAGDIGSGHAVTAIYEITPVGSKAKLIDESRYAEPARAAAQGKASEYGFLRIRYKLPNGFRSRLIEQPIRIDAGVPEALRDSVEFSTAVAGFGQLLRGGKYTGTLKFDDVIRQARGALGDDPYGYRAEFLTLVHKAKEAGGK